MTNPWQMHSSPKSLLVPPKFFYVTNCSPKPPACSSIPLPRDKKHCSLVVMSKGGISYLITIAKLMQNWGYVYAILFDFLNNFSLFRKGNRGFICVSAVINLASPPTTHRRVSTLTPCPSFNGWRGMAELWVPLSGFFWNWKKNFFTMKLIWEKNFNDIVWWNTSWDIVIMCYIDQIDILIFF
jgi:hypothetical protein